MSVMRPVGAFLRPISTPLIQMTMPSSAHVFTHAHSGISEVSVKVLVAYVAIGC